MVPARFVQDPAAPTMALCAACRPNVRREQWRRRTGAAWPRPWSIAVWHDAVPRATGHDCQRDAAIVGLRRIQQRVINVERGAALSQCEKQDSVDTIASSRTSHGIGNVRGRDEAGMQSGDDVRVAHGHKRGGRPPRQQRIARCRYGYC
ncbi:orphan protein [Pandoravirus kuranda]|uniref:Orphan protein n=1 Tax=Pandoravirus kuranda TaxID=3019033 RepID=A0AA95ECS2_9VIRU|nr:orphan protein [Pandoravirus kuranda]